MPLLKNIILYSFIIISCSLMSFKALGQEIVAEQDTVVEKSKADRTVKRATIFSVVIPGSGQIYNKKYWKAPIVWAGMGAFSYFAYDNNHEFLRYKNAFLLRQDGGVDEFSDILNDDGLINEMDRWRRYRDLNLIGALLFYVVQIVDANVDASLADFDVSNDLSLRISNPGVRIGNPQSMGLTLSLNF
jgi:hypothetical protein